MVIGIISTHAEGSYQSHLIHVCMTRAQALGHGCVVLGTGPMGEGACHPLGHNPVLDLAGPWLDGIVVFGGALQGQFGNDFIMERIGRLRGMPLVNISSCIPGVTTVIADNRAGMYALVDHLVREHGLRRIAYFPLIAGHPENQDRFEGYLAALADNGISFDPALVVPDTVYPDAGRGFAILAEERGLAPGSGFEALVLADEHLQVETSRVLAQRGLRIPNDLRLAGFDFIGAQDPGYTMLSVAQPLAEMGKMAVDLVDRAIHGEILPPLVAIKPRLVSGTSCGCPDVHFWVPTVPDWQNAPGDQERGTITALVGQIENDASPDIQHHIPALRECLLHDLYEGCDSEGSEFLRESRQILAGIDTQGTQDIETELFLLEEAIRLLVRLRRSIGGSGLSGVTRVRADSLVLGAIQLFSEARYTCHEGLMHIHRRIDWRIRTTVQHINAVSSRSQLLEQVVSHCRWLEIPGMAICLQDAGQGRPARMLVASLGGVRVDLPEEGIVVPSGRILPEPVWTGFANANSLVLPLRYQNSDLGYMVMAIPRQYSQDLFVYHTLRLAVSGALHSTGLIIENERARRSAEMANRAKGEFLARMSHELRTPLNGVLGFSELLLRDGGLNAEQLESVQIINNSGEYLLSLINDLLDLSRIEAQRFDLNPRTVPLKPILSEVVQLIGGRAAAKRLDFRFQWIGPEPETITTDDRRLRQILLNLLSNACKFTESGWVQLLIEATALDGGRCRLRFEIADSGVGMGPTAVERLFQPFEQVGDAASRVEGTGLGLVISQSLATLMGGRIEVSSLLGHGSRFWFSIECPATLFAPEPDASMPDGPATEICGYEGDPEWILVVDDNANNRHLVINMLEPLGFSLSQAVDGQETLESLEVAMPDIILMDLFMPGLSGTETVQAIRAMPGGAAPAIIMISASANESDRQQAMAAGCNGFLAKPFGFDDLTDCLGRCAGVRWRRAVPGSMAALPPGELVYPDIEDCRHLLDLARSGKLPRIAEYRRTRLGGNPALEPFLRQLDGLLSDFDGAGIICLLEARVASADTEAHHG